MALRKFNVLLSLNMKRIGCIIEQFEKYLLRMEKISLINFNLAKKQKPQQNALFLIQLINKLFYV